MGIVSKAKAKAKSVASKVKSTVSKAVSKVKNTASVSSSSSKSSQPNMSMYTPPKQVVIPKLAPGPQSTNIPKVPAPVKPINVPSSGPGPQSVKPGTPGGSSSYIAPAAPVSSQLKALASSSSSSSSSNRSSSGGGGGGGSPSRPTQPTVPTPTPSVPNPNRPTDPGQPRPPRLPKEPKTPKEKEAATDKYFKQLVEALQVSQEEQELMDQDVSLDSELRNLNQGQDTMNQEANEQPIALPFITGQQRAIENRYALKRSDVTNRKQTLQQRLANLQNRRQSAIDVSKTGLDYSMKQDDRLFDRTQQIFSNQLQLNKYKDGVTQQQFENDLAQQKLAAKTTPTSPTSSTPSSAVPYQGGYDSSQGNDYMNMKMTDVKAEAQRMFPAMATQLISSLTDEQLKLFMNDFTETQNAQQISLDPQLYLIGWKQAAGIGAKSSSTSERTM